MSTDSNLKIRGLYQGDNELSSVSEGALVRADNVVIPSLDTAESRRGQKLEGLTIGSSASPNEWFPFDGGKVAHVGTNELYQDTPSAGGYPAISGSFEPVDPDLLRMKFVEMAQNLYFNTSLGLRLLEAIDGAATQAGIPKATRCEAGTYSYGTGANWLAAGSSVAYAHVWGKKDSHSNVKLGAPSNSAVVNNAALVVPVGGIVRTAPDGPHPAGKVTVTIRTPIFLTAADTLTLSPGEADFAAGVKIVRTLAVLQGGFTYDEAGSNTASTLEQTFTPPARGALVRAYLPSGVTDSSGHFVRFYRSLSTVGETPSPDMYQVAELIPTAGDVIQGYVQFIDGTPDSMLGGAPPLYTSPNVGEGIGSANEPPPLAKDIFEFDGRMWFLNTTSKHRFFLSLLGVFTASGDLGVQNNDTITIAGQTYTFKTSVSGTNPVQITTTAGSVALNIDAVARALVNAINANTSNTTVTAYYVSGVDDAPGRLLIEERAIGGAAFAVYGSRKTSWFPALPTSSTGAPESDNARKPNGLFCSKRGQPEAVPLTNEIPDIGPKGREAIRAVPLRDKIIIAIKDVGFWTVSKSGNSYRVDALDRTAKLLVPDTLVEHSNQLIGLTDQGVCSISDAGVRILSAPIERDLLLPLLAEAADQVKALAFAVSCEADRQYQLWLPSSPGDMVCTQAFVYNSLRNAWTRWEGNRTCGRVNPADGLLYLGDGDTNRLRVERKNYDFTDYADDETALVVSSGGVTAGGSSLVLDSAVGLATGDALVQYDGGGAMTFAAVVTSIDVTNPAAPVVGFTGNNGADPVEGAITAFRAISCDLKWAARGEDAAITKQHREVSLHFSQANFHALATYFESEVSREEEAGKVLESKHYSTGGTYYAGEVYPQNLRAEVPIAAQRCTRLQVGFRITEALAQWRLNGRSVTAEKISEKNSP